MTGLGKEFIEVARMYYEGEEDVIDVACDLLYDMYISTGDIKYAIEMETLYDLARSSK